MAQAYAVSHTSNKTFRALNYVPEVDAFHRLKGAHGTLRLGDMLAAMGPAFGRVFIRYDCKPEYGEELLSQSDMFAAEPCGRIIRGNALRRLEDHRIHRWQILLAGAGTLGESELYGRSIIADGRLEGKIVGPDANVLVFEEPGGVLNLYTYAFLCTTLGLRAVRSTSYGTKLLRQRPDILSDLPIPLAAPETMEWIASLIRDAVEARESYLVEIRAARKAIENLPEARFALESCRDRVARCVIWRGPFPTLQAWTYASAGEALAHLRRAWPGRLGDVLQAPGMAHGGRFARVRCKAPHGVDFLSQRDIFMIRPVGQRIQIPQGETGRLVTPDELLIAGDGQLTEGALFGRAQLVTSDIEGRAVTEHAVRCRPKPNARNTIYAFLSTLLGLRLLRTTAFGTSIPKMNTSLAENLPIPDFGDNDLARVTSHVDAALEARRLAATAEAEAVRIIEEEVLPQWLA